MKGDKQTHNYMDGHRDSMKELAKGRFFEKFAGDPSAIRRAFFNINYAIAIIVKWFQNLNFVASSSVSGIPKLWHDGYFSHMGDAQDRTSSDKT